MYTADGKFRDFAFMGFRTSDEAQRAVKMFNSTYIQMRKIQVQIALDSADMTKPRAWSKYSIGSSAYDRLSKKAEDKELALKLEKEDQESGGLHTRLKDALKSGDEKGKKFKEYSTLDEVKDDLEFQEFAEMHKNKAHRNLWSNDIMTGDNVQKKIADKAKKSASENESKGTDDGEHSKGVSDLEYLKSKMSSSSNLAVDSESDESDPQNVAAEKKSGKKKKKKKKTTTEDEKSQFTVKMRGLPKGSTKDQIRKFYEPLKLKKITVKSSKGAVKSTIAYVEFNNDNDTTEAMTKDKQYIGKFKISLSKQAKPNVAPAEDVIKKPPRIWDKLKDDEEEPIAETGRLFVRNLSYYCTEEDLEKLFGEFGDLTEVQLPVDYLSKKIKGFAFITYMIPENAVRAFTTLDGTSFMGKLIHILPSKEKKEEFEITDDMTYKQKQQMLKKKQAGSSHNWNALFLGANAVADAMAAKYNTDKSAILDAEQNRSLGVRLALGETQIVQETRQFLLDNGVALDAFSQAAAKRSNTCILVKNLPASTTPDQLEELFSKYGEVFRIVLPPSGITAIVQMPVPVEAQAAFKRLAYKRFGDTPLYLEWAPTGTLLNEQEVQETAKSRKEQESEEVKSEIEAEVKVEPSTSDATMDDKQEDSESDDDTPQVGCTVFVKNLNWTSKEDSIKTCLEASGPIRSVTIVKKKDPKKPGVMLPLGYGFVEYKRAESAKRALREQQHCFLDGHKLELKISNRTTTVQKQGRGRQKEKKQTSTKILVRNIPFEAKHSELKELFSVFGELKTVRLPKKYSGTGSHRGFAFVDFLTKHDAKRAFDALCHSTHLYGRRLVLEWAEAEQSIDDLRKSTAAHFYEDPATKKLKYSDLLDDLGPDTGGRK